MATNNAFNTYIVPTVNNEVTEPSQPAFLAHLNAADNDVTGNGTVYTLGTNTAFTEIFDQNADLALNPVTFTAPVTGRYILNLGVVLGTLGTATRLNSYLITSNRTYQLHNGANPSATGSGYTNIEALADMDATDTATFAVMANGVGADNSDLISGATFFTYVSGNLEC